VGAAARRLLARQVFDAFDERGAVPPIGRSSVLDG
jgi:hypothetical protein